MKKFTYLVIATAALGMVACTGGNKAGYVVTGTVEGASDGDTVYLQEANGRNLVKLDTAVITKGTFTFEGTQDSVVSRYITCEVDGEPLMIDFFLENGKINVALTKDNDSATGTANNDAYQIVRAQINDISKKMNAIYQSMGDSSLSDEQKEAKQKEGAQLEEQYDKAIKEGVQNNITNPVGVFLFKQTFYNNSTAENEALLQGKVVLVDFWASWCGPCRREMPNLVEAYAKFKGKNFEIVGVSLDQDGAAWKEAINKLNMTWPQMSDLKFWQSEGAQLYAVNSIPHTVLIDGDGTIIARGLHGEELQTKIAEAVK